MTQNNNKKLRDIVLEIHPTVFEVFLEESMMQDRDESVNHKVRISHRVLRDVWSNFSEITGKSLQELDTATLGDFIEIAEEKYPSGIHFLKFFVRSLEVIDKCLESREATIAAPPIKRTMSEHFPEYFNENE